MKLGEAIHDAKARRKPSGFSFAIADGIRFVREDDWDEVTRDASLFFRRDVLTTIEDDGPSIIRHRYAIIYEGKRPSRL